MCCNMDLTMYSYKFEDCVVNPRRDVLDCSLVGLCGLSAQATDWYRRQYLRILEGSPALSRQP